MADQTNSLLDDYAALVSPGHVAALRSTGLGIVEADRQGPYIFDDAGKRYVDCYGSAGIFNLGRRHPELVAELGRAARETDQGNFPMISAEKAMLGQRLAEFVPGPLDCSVFSVMRGEAIDFACKLARGATGRSELVTISGAWLGQTGFAMSLSQRDDKALFAPLIPDVTSIPAGAAGAAERAISDRTAAVIVEPIQAENHCWEASRRYLQRLRELCHERGAVLVYDETQSGMGRTGEKFAFEHVAAGPDILVIGEALGGGMFPIAATLYTQRLGEFMNAHPLIHLSTFGGSDVGCRVACKALELYSRDRPWHNAAARGAALHAELDALAARPGSVIESVAGRGLLLSLKLASAPAAQRFSKLAAGHGIIAAPGQVATDTVVLRPSLLIDDEQTAAIGAAVEATAEEMGESS